MAVILKCPHCEIKFRHQYSDEAQWPDYCPNKKCGVYMGVSHVADDDVIMPFLKSAATKANDKLYRDMEKGSEFRAEKAAEMAGTSVADMSALKITNLNDRKDAEQAAILSQNPVSDFMKANPGLGGFQGANGVGYSGAVQTGPAANSGARMRSGLQEHHARLTGGAAVSDRPGLETQQPGYRRRG